MSVRDTSARMQQALLSLALVVATACAGAGAGGVGRGGRVSPGTVANGQLAPGRAAATSYGPGEGACQSSGTISKVVDELAGAASRAGRPAPELDPRVCAVAETFLGWDPAAQGTPRPAVLAFVSSWFGLPATVTMATVGALGPLPASPSSEAANEEQVVDRVVQAVGNAALNAVQPRLGIAIQRQRKGRDEVAYRISVAFADVPVQLDPFPRRLDLGQQATLSGRLLAGVKNPKVFVSDASGGLLSPEQPPGEAFKADVRCGDRPGRIQIEIRGEYEGGTPTVASFPVACGQDAPASVAIAPPPWPSDQAAAERRILELVNEERVRAGLAPLQADAAIAAVARSISADLADRGGAPGGPDVGERLRKEGIASTLVLQSAAAERSFERAHERLMASPSNRANLMSPDATHAGVGAAVKADAEGRPIVYVTELFIRELPPVDVATTRQALRDAVAQKRRDARTNAVASDERLEEVAQAYAEAVAAAGGALPKEKHTELTSPLNKTFRTVTMVAGAKQEPMDFAEEPQTTSPGKALGVGVAQGKHPVLGRNATYVVLMVGTPRAGAATPARTGKLPRKPTR